MTDEPASFYNDHEPFCCSWLGNLMAAGEVPYGDIDGRDFREITADEVRGYSQCHFFAGLGGWPLACRLAGVDPGLPLWTASLPCQPFSQAGSGKAEEDDRHLWPDFLRLVRECRPLRLVGEQVTGTKGDRWLDGVRSSLEAAGYAFGSCSLPAAAAGAPHRRMRHFWGAVRLADGHGAGREGARGPAKQGVPRGVGSRPAGAGGGGPPDGAAGPVADARSDGDIARGRHAAVEGGHGSEGGISIRGGRELRGAGPLADADGRGLDGAALHLPERGPLQAVPDAAGAGRLDGRPVTVGVTGSAGHQGHVGATPQGGGHGRVRDADGPTGPPSLPDERRPWDDCRVILCRDGKHRRVPVEPGFQPLAHGIPFRKADPRLAELLARLRGMGYGPAAALALVKRARAFRKGALRAAGNAIVPQVAAIFLECFLGAEQDMRASR
jgi:DNA (cytosine-5)-methyltransferase 1